MEVSAMMTATFNDGTACRLETVHGDAFEPREGERFLFEFPEGALKEGAIHYGHPSEACYDNPPRRAVFDRRTKIIAIEVC